MPITQSDFKLLSRWAKESVGLTLSPDNSHLLEIRLEAMLRKHDFSGMSELVQRLVLSVEGTEFYDDSIRAVTNQETLFFRTPKQYHYLRDTLLPQLVCEGRRHERLGIWSAASSTGQEIYSLAMMLSEHFPQIATWDVQIDATDVSEAALRTAAKGEFSQFEVDRGLPSGYLDKYFIKTGEDTYEVYDDIKRMINFRYMNLTDEWRRVPPYHIILMRNVLIYLDDEAKRKIFEKLKLYLHTDGILMLGGAEAMIDLDPDWEMVCDEDIIYYRLSEI